MGVIFVKDIDREGIGMVEEGSAIALFSPVQQGTVGCGEAGRSIAMVLVGEFGVMPSMALRGNAVCS